MSERIIPKVGELYRNWRRGIWVVECLSMMEDTLEQLVTIRGVDDSQRWTMTYEKFNATVEGQPRFTLVYPLSLYSSAWD